MRAADRNTSFALLVRHTHNTTFGARLLELTAFASGAGCKLMFDSTGFELRNLRGSKTLFAISNSAAKMEENDFKGYIRDVFRGCK